MTALVYELFRYTNADGTAKEWAYADVGNGTAEIRWGRAGRLRQSQRKPLDETRVRSDHKQRRGYRYIGRGTMDACGAVTIPSRNRSCGPVSKAQPQTKCDPIDIAALLGGDEEGFYF